MKFIESITRGFQMARHWMFCLLLLIGCSGGSNSSDPVEKTGDQGNTDGLELTRNWDKNLCTRAQMAVVAGLGEGDIVNASHDDSSFYSSKTAINDDNKIEIHGNLHGDKGVLDLTVDCKLVRFDRVKSKLGLDVEQGETCGAVNQMTFEQTLKSLDANTRNKYLASGRELRFAPDLQATAGGEWLRTEVNQFQLSEGDHVSIPSVVLNIPWKEGANDPTTGVHYCKLTSLETMKRWISELAFERDATPLPIVEAQCIPRYSQAKGSCRFTPPFLGEEICQDFVGLSWDSESMALDCQNKGGSWSPSSCQQTLKQNELAKCVIQCSKPFEKIWNMYSDPSKYGINMDSVCDKFEQAPEVWESVGQVETVTLNIDQDETDFYYPEVSETYPLLIFLQGGRVDKKYYSQYARQVAAAGFIVAVPNHLSSPFGSPELFSQLSTIDNLELFLENANQEEGHRFFALWDGSIALLGHSYGAAAAIDAIQNTCRFPFCDGKVYTKSQRIKALALTGINTKPIYGDKIFPTFNKGMPIAFINGQLDSNATFEQTKQSYDLIQDPPKMFVAVKGANHYNVADLNNPSGPKGDLAVPTIPQAYAVGQTSYWTIAFLKAYVLGDPEAHAVINQSIDEEVGGVVKMSLDAR